MNASTPAANPATNSPRNTKGDVDLNGDVVDELDQLVTREVRLDDRLRAAICAQTPELADDQLRAVKQLVRPWTVTR